MKKLVLAVAAAVAGTVFGTTHNVPADGDLETVVAAAADGDEVVIAANAEPYVLTAALTVPAGVTVRGATGDWKDVVVSGGDAVGGFILSEGSALRDVTVSHCKAEPVKGSIPSAGVTTAMDAVLANCRVTECWASTDIKFSDKETGIGVWAIGGTVTNCVIDGNYSTAPTYNHGVALLMKSASSGKTTQAPLVTHTVITNNWENYMQSDSSSYSGCPGVKASAGTLDHCYIADNYFGVCFSQSISIGAAVYATGAITIKNCSIFNQTWNGPMSETLYGVYLGNASSTVADTIIFGNGHTEGPQNDFGVLTTMAASKCSNVVTGHHREIFDDYVAYKATVADFVRVGGKWIPKPDSPAANCGSEPAWDGVTPVDPPPPAGTTYYVDDVADLQSTIDGAKSGDTVVIRKGTYPLTATISITTPYLTVRGETDDFNDVKLDGQNKVRCVNISVRGATLMNVSLIHGYIKNDNGGGAAALSCGACLRHCRIGDITTAQARVQGVGVNATGGKIIDCVIEDITSTVSPTRTVGAYLSTGSLMDRCIIRNCNTTAVNLSSAYQGRAVLGVHAIGGSAVQNCCIYGNSQGTITSTEYCTTGACFLEDAFSSIRNSFVYNNTYNGDSGAIPSYGIGAGVASPVIVNCVVLENGPKDGVRSHNFVGAASCKNCLTDAVSAEGATDCKVGTLVEHFAANGDLWKLKGGSSLIDYGLASFAVDQGLDLDGTNRLEDAAIDVGPWEYHKPALGVALDAGTYEAFDRLETTLTATPEGDTEGVGYAWYLDAAAEPFAEGDASSVPLVLDEVGTFVIRVVVTNAAQAVASTERTFTVRQGTYYVAEVNPNAEAPYDTPARAATNIADAVALADPGATVTIMNGTHRLKGQLDVGKAITLRGESRDGAVIHGQGATRGVVMTAVGAVLADLTVSDCRGTQNRTSSGVWMGAGTVMSNCVVRNCTEGDNNLGVGVNCSNGRIYDSVITNNVGGHGTGFYMTGVNALMCRTLVRGNRSGKVAGGSYSPLAAGGVLEDGEIRDCVIVGNSATPGSWSPPITAASVSGVLVKSGTMVSCTVVGNTFTMKEEEAEAYTEYSGAVACESGSIVNCLIADNFGNGALVDNALNGTRPSRYTTCCTSSIESFPEGNVSSMPGPVYRYSKRLGEYRLTQGSPCAGNGTWQTWMADAPDFYGRAWNPDRVDIGAAVYDCKGLLLQVK